MADLTAQELREIVSYDQETGVFRWRRTLSNRRQEGRVAGCICKRSGYNLIGIRGRVYTANRLAWLFMTGEWPAKCIDHINGNRRDDRWGNLRQALHAENLQNRGAQKNNTSGFKGVYWHSQAQKWRARITAFGRSHSLGLFETAELAHAAYCKAAIERHGDFARVK